MQTPLWPNESPAHLAGPHVPELAGRRPSWRPHPGRAAGRASSMGQTMSSLEARAATPHIGGSLERILVVDHEPQIHRLLRAPLGTAGYVIERADTASEALRLARARMPDTVLLDLGLPDLAGQETLSLLRSFTHVPVIVLSARDSEADKIAALDAGADDYIVKPFYVGELLARIRVALRHRRQLTGTAALLCFDGMDVDMARREARVGGVRVALTPKEWTLLCLLCRNAGRVMTHRQLLTAIWGAAHAENTQYLRICVGTLRQKLGDAARLIVTETAVGYRMMDAR